MKKVVVLLTLTLAIFLLAGCTSDELVSDDTNTDVITSSSSSESNDESSNDTSAESGGSNGGDSWSKEY